tara:strand:- start:816 stop:1013 length:198 start_codon:yes stop_codon:yes gene_type:complete
MNLVTCSEYKVGDLVQLQLTGGDLEYYGDVVEVGVSSMKVEIPFINSAVTYTLAEGQQVTSLHKG